MLLCCPRCTLTEERETYLDLNLLYLDVDLEKKKPKQSVAHKILIYLPPWKRIPLKSSSEHGCSDFTIRKDAIKAELIEMLYLNFNPFS